MDAKELIFNMYKDKVVVSKKFKLEIEKRFNLSQREISDLFVKIQNYQIKKYGARLDHNDIIHSKEECKKLAFNSKTRKTQRKYCKWETAEHNRKYNYL